MASRYGAINAVVLVEPRLVGLDKGVAYIVDGSTIYKLRTDDTVVVPWSGSGAGEMNLPR